MFLHSSHSFLQFNEPTFLGHPQPIQVKSNQLLHFLWTCLTSDQDLWQQYYTYIAAGYDEAYWRRNRNSRTDNGVWLVIFVLSMCCCMFAITGSLRRNTCFVVCLVSSFSFALMTHFPGLQHEGSKHKRFFQNVVQTYCPLQHAKSNCIQVRTAVQ